MRKGDELFELIQSLDPSERRAFTLYSKRFGSDPRYLTLFKVFCELPKYDAAEVLRLNSQIKKAQLHVSKNYLRELILDLLVHQSSESPRRRLKRDLAKIEMMESRGLSSFTLSRIRRARKAAEENEDLASLIEVQSLERQLLTKKFYAPDVQNKLDALAAERRLIFAQIEIENEYAELNDRTRIAFGVQGSARNQEDRSAIEKLLAEPLLTDPSRAHSFVAKYLYHIVRCRCLFWIGRVAEAEREASEAIKLFDQLPGRKRSMPSEYFVALMWKYDSGFDHLDSAEAKRILKQMRSVKISDKNIAARYEVVIAAKELVLLSRHGSIRERETFIQTVDTAIADHGAILTTVALETLLFTRAIALFLNRRFNEALRDLNNILSTKEVIRGLDMRCDLRLFNLVLHFELENKAYMPSALKSSYQYLYKQRKLFQSEKALFALLKALADTSSTKPKLLALDKFLSRIKALRSIPEESFFGQYFDVVLWAETKRRELSVQ